jgi:hypothetical protein
MAGTEEDFLELLAGEVFIDMDRCVKEGETRRIWCGESEAFTVT